MADLPVDPEVTPAAVVTPDNTPKPRHCEFCGCQLSERGEVLAMSEKAKKLVRQETRIDTLSETVQARDGEVAQLRTENADLKRQLLPPVKDSSGSFLK